MAKHVWTCPRCGQRDNPRTSRRCAGCAAVCRPPKRAPAHRATLDTMSVGDVAVLSVVIHGGAAYACACCGREREPGKLRYRDHDHTTGEVRGLLCYQCNRLALATNGLGSVLAILAYLVRARVFHTRRRLSGLSA